jgi:hypothetical protein
MSEETLVKALFDAQSKEEFAIAFEDVKEFWWRELRKPSEPPRGFVEGRLDKYPGLKEHAKLFYDRDVCDKERAQRHSKKDKIQEENK